MSWRDEANKILNGMTESEWKSMSSFLRSRGFTAFATTYPNGKSRTNERQPEDLYPDGYKPVEPVNETKLEAIFRGIYEFMG